MQKQQCVNVQKTQTSCQRSCSGQSLSCLLLVFLEGYCLRRSRCQCRAPETQTDRRGGKPCATECGAGFVLQSGKALPPSVRTTGRICSSSLSGPDPKKKRRKEWRWLKLWSSISENLQYICDICISNVCAFLPSLLRLRSAAGSALLSCPSKTVKNKLISIVITRCKT